MDNFAYANRTMSMLLGCEQVRRHCFEATRAHAISWRITHLREVSRAHHKSVLAVMTHILCWLTGHGSVGSAAGAAAQRLV